MENGILFHKNIEKWDFIEFLMLKYSSDLSISQTIDPILFH